VRSHPQKERVLVPYLQYGPNNQYLQLMEAAVVARILGRSLMIPSFQAWVNDETGSRGQSVAFGDTFDTDAVKRFVALSLPPSAGRSAEGWEGYTLIAASDYKKEKMAAYVQQQHLPCCPEKRRAKTPRLAAPDDVRALTREFGVSGSTPVVGWYSFFLLDRALVLEAAAAFRHAPQIRSRTATLVRALFGGERFLAVHLRREASNLGCSRGSPTVLCPKEGREWTFETDRVRTEIAQASRRSGVRHVYIATISPAQHPKYRNELSQLLESVQGAKSLSAGSAMAEVLGVAPERLTRYEQSLIEQELCMTAFAFLGSERSTWTGNVELTREATGVHNSFFFGQVMQR